MPKLEELNPELIPVFSRNIDLLKRQYRFYQRKMDELKSSLLAEEEEVMRISIDKLRKCEDPALVLFEILKDDGFNASEVEQILDSLEKSSGKCFYSSRYQVVKDRKHLIVSPIETPQQEEKKIDKIEDLEALGFKVEKFPINVAPVFTPDSNILYVDAKKLFFPLILRHWQDGDRFCPFGMQGSKKLSDFFIDQKINILEKKNVQVLCSADKIVWLVGLRGDDRFKIDHQTENYYKIQYYGSI